AAPFTIIAQENNGRHIAFRHFGEQNVEAFEYAFVEFSLFRLKRRSYAGNVVEQTFAFGTGHNAQARNAVLFQEIELVAQPFDTALLVLFKPQKRPIPIIRPDKIIRLAAFLEPAVLCQNKITAECSKIK